MKKFLITLLIGGFIMAGASAKTAVVYFSATGTTERMAKSVATEMGADIFEIQPVHKYTDADLNWHDKQSNATTPKAVPQSQTKLTFPLTTP